MEKSLEELAHYVGGERVGENVLIKGVIGLSQARSGYLTFCDDPALLSKAMATEAAAVIVPSDVTDFSMPHIRIRNPRLAFARILELFHPKKVHKPGIHPSAVLGNDVILGSEVSIGAHAVVGDRVLLGDRVIIYPLAYIDDDVSIGDDSVIYPHVSVMRGCLLGSRVILHSGAVLGADGFGFVKDGHCNVKIPQVGTVVLGDDVEIGANTTIDRATTDSTFVGKGTKIDNLIQIGHNTRIGEDCIIVSQAGLAGSITVGDRVTIAAQAGVKDHVEIGSDCIIAGRAGVTKKVPPGSLVSGFPAKPHRQELHIEAAVAKLPELLVQIRDMEKRIEKLCQDSESRPSQ